LANQALIDSAIPPRLMLAPADLRTDGASFGTLRSKVLRRPRGSRLILDLSAVPQPDISVIAVLVRVEGEARERGIRVELTGIGEQLARALEGASEHLLSDEAASQPSEPLFERVGEQALRAAADFVSWRQFTARVLTAIFVDPFAGKPWNWAGVVDQMDLIGVRGTTIVVFISLLVGAVLALNGARELSQFGASIFVANLVGVSMTREMGPLITAVIVAGRSGSAIAAELGTMVVAEEIDAMRTMALEPSRFLVAPRVIAMLVMLPCLTVISDLLGMTGGYLVGLSMGLGSDNYLRQTAQTLFISDIISGLIKAAVFGLLIALICCYEGLQVSGGARGVGEATTRAVVFSIIAAIAADSVFTLLFYFTG
jgi:phospholipid/cholesterol/gamma-HCH transport system permease protein